MQKLRGWHTFRVTEGYMRRMSHESHADSTPCQPAVSRALHSKAICEATAIPPSQQRLLMGCEALNVPHMQLAPSTSRHIVAITVMKLWCGAGEKTRKKMEKHSQAAHQSCEILWSLEILKCWKKAEDGIQLDSLCVDSDELSLTLVRRSLDQAVHGQLTWPNGAIRFLPDPPGKVVGGGSLWRKVGSSSGSARGAKWQSGGLRSASERTFAKGAPWGNTENLAYPKYPKVMANFWS